MFKIIKKYKTTIGILLVILFLYLALRKISWAELGTIFSSITLVLIVWVVLINLTIRLIFSYRWWLLLSYEKRISILQVFHYVNIGYFINSILPARTGDFLKAVMIAKKNSLGKTSCLASVAVERLFDLLGLSMVFLAALFILNLPIYIKQGGFIVLVIASVTLFFFFLLSKRSKTFYNCFSGFSKNKIYLWIIRRFELIFLYSHILRNKEITLGALGATALSWLLYVYAGYIILEKIAPSPYSWHVSLLALLFISVSFVLPTTPGNIGVYQFACILAFSIAEMPREQAIVFSLISQIPVFLLSILLGLYSMGHEGITKKRIDKEGIDNSV